MRCFCRVRECLPGCGLVACLLSAPHGGEVKVKGSASSSGFGGEENRMESLRKFSTRFQARVDVMVIRS